MQIIVWSYFIISHHYLKAINYLNIKSVNIIYISMTLIKSSQKIYFCKKQ